MPERALTSLTVFVAYCQWIRHRVYVTIVVRGTPENRSCIEYLILTNNTIVLD